jgi:hypothetical protein
MLDGLEEAGAFVRIVAELVTEDTKGPGRIAEAVCDLMRGESVDKIGAEGLILALQGIFGGHKELGFRR